MVLPLYEYALGASHVLKLIEVSVFLRIVDEQRF